MDEKAKIELLREALWLTKEKLEIYRLHHTGLYLGGMEYSALMKKANAALEKTK